MLSDLVELERGIRTGWPRRGQATVGRQGWYWAEKHKLSCAISSFTDDFKLNEIFSIQDCFYQKLWQMHYENSK